MYIPGYLVFFEDTCYSTSIHFKEDLMDQDIYQRLAQHLDNLPGGFPPTESGVELRILRRLFTPEEAELDLAEVLWLRYLAGGMLSRIKKTRDGRYYV